jgi:DNA-binding transcriptional MerR regulator
VSATVTAGLRIGEVAKRVGTTPRTIRYYEEIGLLPAGGARESGRHRLYGERDVARLRDALRLKELLGVSLDELKELLEAEEARAALREEWHHGDPATPRRREMLSESLRLLDRQLALVRRRRDEIAALERELAAKRSLATRRLRELGDH